LPDHHGVRRSGRRGHPAHLQPHRGPLRGEEFATLSTATIRAVALGVLGVAFIQAIVVGTVMLIAGVPFAGVLAMVVLVLGIAQAPALIITLPVIAWIWISGNYGTGAAVLWSVLLFIAGMLDNVLKPLLLGRGVDAPMPVILLGALGGLASAGILGMFVGAVLLALGYQIFMWWVDTNPDEVPVERVSKVRNESVARIPLTSTRVAGDGAGGGWAALVPAPRWAPISSGLRCPGWPTGRAAPSSRSPPSRGRASDSCRCGGATSMIPCSTT
jgi:hypothetical protein